MRLSVIEGSDRLTDLINPDRPEVFEVEDPLMGPMVCYQHICICVNNGHTKV